MLEHSTRPLLQEGRSLGTAEKTEATRGTQLAWVETAARLPAANPLMPKVPGLKPLPKRVGRVSRARFHELPFLCAGEQSDACGGSPYARWHGFVACRRPALLGVATEAMARERHLPRK
jgi:hypothetical protein